MGHHNHAAQVKFNSIVPGPILEQYFRNIDLRNQIKFKFLNCV